MTPEQINIAIAEACGEKVCTHYPHKWESRGPEGDSELWCSVCDAPLKELRAQDYFHDLNAMHDVIVCTTAPWSQDTRFQELLEDELDSITCKAGLKIWAAEAKHQAEAFLRTLGKWRANDL